MITDPADTSPEARRIQEHAHRELGPRGRVRIAAELSELARQMRLAGLRQEVPDASEAELIRMYVAETCGVELEPDD